MAEKRLTDLQLEVVEKYNDGEFAHVNSMRVAKYQGDSLFVFALQEAKDASDKEEFAYMLRDTIVELEALLEAVEGSPADGHAAIPLADRYARDVLDDPAKVVCLEVCGVRYVNRGQEVEQCLDHPDFHSVYARIRNEHGDALAHCIGDFASPKAAREYAVHVAAWQNPAWEVHEATVNGWIPLPAAEKQT